MFFTTLNESSKGTIELHHRAGPATKTASSAGRGVEVEHHGTFAGVSLPVKFKELTVGLAPGGGSFVAKNSQTSSSDHASIGVATSALGISWCGLRPDSVLWRASILWARERLSARLVPRRRMTLPESFVMSSMIRRAGRIFIRVVHHRNQRVGDG